ncbi:MAG: N-acetyl-gamma-glutamyl-phosphate reductase [Patescibacteria group bacterium]|nr:N-acetyl-gamma-glutamyl-phosphate reductase [Patescibacteria group bacterium]MDD4611163.1 N-acetyl-gamma-glutamyl-phosphate reductase [Patescibacteria group bacterium]
MVKIGVLGATGYAGFELVKILQKHAEAEIVFATSQRHAGETLDTVHVQAPALPLVTEDDAPFNEVDVVFLALPHTLSAITAMRALEAGCRVIDLSADFRLKEAALYEQWYKTVHPAPHLLGEAVYGLTELAREKIKNARLVANPGCYPTSILLPLYPLLKAGAVAGGIIADCKSGVSGAGREPKQNTHFVEVSDNLSPYKIGQAHQHWPEIKQAMSWWRSPTPNFIFSPHLISLPRGMLSTIYVPISEGFDEAAIRDLFQEVYSDEYFVRILPTGNLATVAHVVRTNRCVVGLTMGDERTLIITCAIDNLLKGASGQAVQNMNVMFDLEETLGLK